MKDEAENLLAFFFLIGVEGQITVSIEARRQATNSSTSAKQAPVLPL